MKITKNQQKIILALLTIPVAIYITNSLINPKQKEYENIKANTWENPFDKL